jgi:hypothetical protein
MAEQEVPQPTERIYMPRPSWAPLFFAFGLALAIAGIYAQGWIVRGWVYSIVGLIFVLAALVSMVRGAGRDFYRLPRRQRVRGAVLPAASLRPPRRG